MHFSILALAGGRKKQKPPLIIWAKIQYKHSFAVWIHKSDCKSLLDYKTYLNFRDVEMCKKNNFVLESVRGINLNWGWCL